MKTFEDIFTDSTPHTFYSVTIKSENDEEIVFDGVLDHHARNVFDDLKDQASDEELGE